MKQGTSWLCSNYVGVFRLPKAAVRAVTDASKAQGTWAGEADTLYNHCEGQGIWYQLHNIPGSYVFKKKKRNKMQDII